MCIPHPAVVHGNLIGLGSQVLPFLGLHGSPHMRLVCCAMYAGLPTVRAEGCARATSWQLQSEHVFPSVFGIGDEAVAV